MMSSQHSPTDSAAQGASGRSFPTVPLCMATAVAVGDERLALMIRQLHFLVQQPGTVEFGQYRWVPLTTKDWTAFFPMWSERRVERLRSKGKELGVLVTKQRLRSAAHYLRVDYQRLAERLAGAGAELPAWMPSDTPPVTLDMFAERDIADAVDTALAGETASAPELIQGDAARDDALSASDSAASPTLTQPRAGSPKWRTAIRQNGEPRSAKMANRSFKTEEKTKKEEKIRAGSSSRRAREPAPAGPAAAAAGPTVEEFEASDFWETLHHLVGWQLAECVPIAKLWFEHRYHETWAEYVFDELKRKQPDRSKPYAVSILARAVEDGEDVAAPCRDVSPFDRRYNPRPVDITEPPASEPDLLRQPPSPPEAAGRSGPIVEAMKGVLQERVTRPSYETWVRDISGVGLIEPDDPTRPAELTIWAPNTFVAEMLYQRMYSLLVAAASQITGRPTEVAVQPPYDP